MLTQVKRKILRSRKRWAQVGGQVIAGSLSRELDGAFSGAEITWNGRASCLLLSFDVDFPEDALALPQVVEHLGRFGLKASFACVGRWVEDYPEEHRAVLEGGHELLNHTYSHPELVNSPQHFQSFRSDLNDRRWDQLDLAEKTAEIKRGHQAVQQVLGYAMSGFRAPHFGNIEPEELYPILAEFGLQYSSSMLAPRCKGLGLPVWRQQVLEIPVTTCPLHPFASLDSWHAFYAHGGWHREDFVEVLIQRLDQGVFFGGLTNIYLDPKDVERVDFARLFAHIKKIENQCWAPTYQHFVDWWRQLNKAVA